MTNKERIAQIRKDAPYEYQKLRQRVDRIRNHPEKSQRIVQEFDDFASLYKEGPSWNKLPAGQLKGLYYALYNMSNASYAYSKGAKELNTVGYKLFGSKYTDADVETQNAIWERFNKIKELTQGARVPSSKIANFVKYEYEFDRLEFSMYKDAFGVTQVAITDATGRTHEEVSERLKDIQNQQAYRTLEMWKRVKD